MFISTAAGEVAQAETAVSEKGPYEGAPNNEPMKRYPKPLGTRPPNTRIIVKREPDLEDMKKWASTIPGFIQGVTNDIDGKPTIIYDYQIAHMLDHAMMRHRDKARQIGISYTFALESLSKTHLKPVQTSIFISYNHEEAMEKIRFARALYDSMPTEFQKKLIVDNKQSLEFEHNGKLSRILSFAQRQPRGKGYNTDIYLDEFAHMTWPEAIYTAAVPVLTRGSGVLTVASTPLGKGSMHYDIGVNRTKYWMFSRMQIFWWDCPALCNNIELARKLAPEMETEERIKKFGTDKLELIFGAMDFDLFRQEYELYYADESVSYYPLSLIRSCVFEDESMHLLEDNIDPEEIVPSWEDVEDDSGHMVRSETIMRFYESEKIVWYCRPKRISSESHSDDEAHAAAIDMIDGLYVAMAAGGFGRQLVVGVDIGRVRDSTEISIFEQIEIRGINLLVERLSIELHAIKFKTQEAVLKYLIDRLHPKKIRVDSTGIGMNIAENLKAYDPSIVEEIDFNIENKKELAQTFRMRLEDRTVAILNDAESVKQIHSIQRSVTEGSQVRFQSIGTKKHHGDKFWAKALAVSCGDQYDRTALAASIVRAAGQRIFTDSKDIRRVIDAQKAVKSTPYVPTIATPRKVGKLFANKVAKNAMSNVFFDSKWYG